MKEKTVKNLFCTGLILSMLTGVWHFFVPWMFDWYGYISDEYRNLEVGIDWTNYMFSLLLTGFSVLLFIKRKKILAGDRDLLIFYGFLVFVWANRFLITFINPWEMEAVWQAICQVPFLIICIIVAIPFVHLIRKKLKD